MRWQQWLLIGWFICTAVYGCTRIGKPPRAFTGEDAAVNVLASAALIALVVSL